MTRHLAISIGKIGVAGMGKVLKTITAHIKLWILQCYHTFIISRPVD